MAQPTPLPSADADARVHCESNAFPNAIAESHTNASSVEFLNTRADTLSNAAPYLNTLASAHAEPNDGADSRPDPGANLPTVAKTLNVANASSDAGAGL
jgi:hypothetical protein